MTITMHQLAVDTFAPRLESLRGILDKAQAHADATGEDLINAQLAPDMFPFARQIAATCHFAKDGIGRLSGQPGLAHGEPKTSWDELKGQVDEAIAIVRAAPAAAFEGAEDRDCSIDVPGDRILALDGSQFMFGLTVPNFYFHLVTAYDILRHKGVPIGKQDFLAGISALIRPK